MVQLLLRACSKAVCLLGKTSQLRERLARLGDGEQRVVPGRRMVRRRAAGFLVPRTSEKACRQ